MWGLWKIFVACFAFAYEYDAFFVVLQNVRLDDDTVLDKIAFADPVQNSSLSNLQLGVILAKWYDHIA